MSMTIIVSQWYSTPMLYSDRSIIFDRTQWLYLVLLLILIILVLFFFQEEDGIRDWSVTGVQTCALPISFWHQFGNSVFLAAMVTILTLLIGSLTSFSVGRMRIRNGWLITNAALLTYVIPASFLAIPFYLIMQRYGLNNNPWSVIAVLVTFATPYAIFIFQEYGRSIPLELDESARIDGASPFQIYYKIYLPLMAPALVAVGTYALLLAWNEYLYQFLLLSSDRSMTVAVALGKFLNSDVAPWNYMMATAIIYALPPIATYYIFRRRMSSGLTMCGFKG